MRRNVLSITSIVPFAVALCQPQTAFAGTGSQQAMKTSVVSSKSKPGCVAIYLNGAERQYESAEQGEELRRALSEMLRLSPSALLKKRYCDYQMNKNRWTAIDVLHRYFLPADARQSIDAKCFQTSIGTARAKAAVRKQLTELSKSLASEPSPFRPKVPEEAPKAVASGSESVTEKADKLFDNTSMNRALQDALTLTEKSDLDGAKKVWVEVIAFMHKPRWFPTAAMVPICLNFAKLADVYVNANRTDDAVQLMRASFEFPFHVKQDEETIDAASHKLVAQLKKSAKREAAKSFLELAVRKTSGERRAKFQELLAGI